MISKARPCCAEQHRLLLEFWDLYWHGPGTVEIEAHGKVYFGHEPSEDAALDDLAALVEDHRCQS